MKYALIPVLTEVSQLMEEYGQEDLTEEEFVEAHDPYGLRADEITRIFYKIYQANK